MSELPSLEDRVQKRLKRPFLSFFTPKTAIVALILSVAVLATVSLITNRAVTEIQEVSRERQILNMVVGSWAGYNECRSLRVFRKYSFDEDWTFVTEDSSGKEFPGTFELDLDDDIEQFHLILPDGVDSFDLMLLDEERLLLEYGEWRGRSGNRCNIDLKRQAVIDNR